MMPKLTRIYTRTGDKGLTGLIGGGRIKKSAPRIEVYGTVDELSSTIGVARAALGPLLATQRRASRLDAWLAWTQDKLFDLGAELATPPAVLSKHPAVTRDDARALERAIDEVQRDLPALSNFIHPGGSMAGAQLHVARTVCRRAERRLVALTDAQESAASDALVFLNRLSDALFVWARWINDANGVAEHLWNHCSEPPKK